MHSDEPNPGTDPGLFIVRRRENFIYWEAWRQWMSGELGKKFFPDAMTTWSKWPPTTDEGATIVARKINEIRKEIKWGHTVPENPRPWRMWTPTEMNEIEASEDKRIKEESDIPVRSLEDIQTLIRRTRNRHGFPRTSQDRTPVESKGGDQGNKGKRATHKMLSEELV